jgi:hypothetical protein
MTEFDTPIGEVPELGLLTSEAEPEDAEDVEEAAAHSYLLAANDGDPERAEGELSRWRDQREIRAEDELRDDEARELWEGLPEQIQADYRSMYRIEAVAIKAYWTWWAAATGTSLFAGSQPSIAAPLRERPRGGA